MALDRKWSEARLLALKISQAELARRMGIEKAMVCRSLSGQRTFTLEDAVNMARVFGVSVDEVARSIGLGVARSANSHMDQGVLAEAFAAGMALAAKQRV